VKTPDLSQERVAVIGLGYVGLPVALAFARDYPGTVGFDVDARRVTELEAGRDRTEECTAEELKASSLKLTADALALAGATAFVVAVPTPVDESNRPDLEPLRAACRTIGPALRRGAVVVFESTVYPGVTEDVCGPALEHASGLVSGKDFFLGYSPERINPGDREHRLETVIKVVAGQDAATLERVAALYSRIVPAGVHRASSIKVAEASKVFENTQRDLNIALMNELAIICDRLGIRTADVLAAAGTKWNFLKFTPGLVGGHCIGVDPYYLTAKAESEGYFPELILTGRRLNDRMGVYIAQKVVSLLIDTGRPVKGARVGVLGLTFKEDVPDLRNSRVPDIVEELTSVGLEVVVHDPHALADEVEGRWGITLAPLSALTGLDAIVVAVAHQEFRHVGPAALAARLKPGGVLVDVKSVMDPNKVPAGIRYWSL
jgi:UDP-N-acetyl-D-galactosamine dehydrogenase